MKRDGVRMVCGLVDLGGWVKAVKSMAAIRARICLINDCALRTVRNQHDNLKTI